MRSPTAASSSPSSFLSSSRSTTASPLPPTSTNATPWPKPTIVPSIVCPLSYCFALSEAANNVAKSSSGSVNATPDRILPENDVRSELRRSSGRSLSRRLQALGVRPEDQVADIRVEAAPPVRQVAGDDDDV